MFSPSSHKGERAWIWILALVNLGLVLRSIHIQNVDLAIATKWGIRVLIFLLYLAGLMLSYRSRVRPRVHLWLTHLPFLIGPVYHLFHTLHRLGIFRFF